MNEKLANVVNELQRMWQNEHPLRWTLKFEELIDEAYRLMDFADGEARKAFDEFCEMMDSDTREFILDNYC